ncbi:putative serine/threonine-protein kinase mkcE [Nosema granulosis]|uniref:Serine/threonine-protein kinase mkcE n=1 Tax=Nosema granulosis TaxID=83296 RepID=A0A9P6GXU1_9MICR|nr:putative serine/threonine-protein kinase mkcE [Nosema granulosis]
MRFKTKNRMGYYFMQLYNKTCLYSSYYTRRYLKKCLLTLLTLLVLALATWFFLFTNKIFFQKKRALMEKKFYAYINKTMDEILKLKTRYKQNTEFAKLTPALPLQPLKMTMTTAVFLITDLSPYVVLKRIIVNKKSPIHEDEIALKLNHRNIVKSTNSETMTYVDANGEKQTLIWLYMEYLPIRISHKTVNRDEETLRKIARDVLHGLNYLHKQNIAHLDLKIANIMGDEDENGVFYKIIDFGYARKIDEGEIKIPMKNYGTYPYKPPEIVLKNIHGMKGDIWCLGAIILFLRNGKTPFYDSKGNKQTDKYKEFLLGERTIPLSSDASPEIKDFISVCLQLDRNQRPSAEELLKHKFITGKEDGVMYQTDSEDSGYFSSSTSEEESIEVNWL